MNHPYPEHIRQAVAGQFAGLLGYVFGDLPEHDQDLFRRNADMILQALWDASRVDSIEQLESVPDFASLVDGEGFTYRTYELRNPKVFPVNIIYWGDTDE